jgi:5-methylthioadenosine/S-adenosylhomocysteine deaminase
MNILIHNATVITMNSGRIIYDGAVAIEDSIITDIGKTSTLKRKYHTGYEKIDATNKIVMPGLINTHQHAAMSLLRGYADDLPLQEWLEKWIWPIEKHMTPRDIYAGALLTAIESIMGGTTTVNTMYHYTQKENEARAFTDAGLRGVVGHVCFSWRKKEDRKALHELANNWHGKADGSIRVSVDPHSPYTVDPEYMQELKAIRDELSEKCRSTQAPIITHTHIAETADEQEKIRNTFNVQQKQSIMAYLDSLGVLDEHVTAAHCVWLTEKDLAIMKKRNVKVSHNPISNLKLATGVSPVPKMLRKAITVSLGTDSPCSNNTADMFEVMKTAALLHKGVNMDPILLPAGKILEMATIKGAEALAWEREIGSIETGKKADLIIINFKKPHLCPLYNEESHLVYATKSSDVETVIINGRIVMENQKPVTVNAEKAMETAEKTKKTLLARLQN